MQPHIIYTHMYVYSDVTLENWDLKEYVGNGVMGEVVYKDASHPKNKQIYSHTIIFKN